MHVSFSYFIFLFLPFSVYFPQIEFGTCLGNFESLVHLPVESVAPLFPNRMKQVFVHSSLLIIYMPTQIQSDVKVHDRVES